MWRPRCDELGWLLLATAVINAALAYALLHCLGGFILKRFAIFAALAAAAAALSGCGTLSPLAVNTKATAEAQKVQADAKADFDRALAKRLDHCRITGQTGGGVGGLAGTGTGLSASLSFDCPARPWDVAPSSTEPAESR